MSSRYLFNTSGRYVAFISGSNVFTPNGRWLGYLDNGNEFWGEDGRFIGYVMDDDRVVARRNEINRIPRIRRIPPISPIPPIRPLPRLGKLRLPYPYVDVFEEER